MTMTVHSLQHLETHVIENGPLWANSLFPFENMVKEIGHLYSGTRHIRDQVSCVFVEEHMFTGSFGAMQKSAIAICLYLYRFFKILF